VQHGVRPVIFKVPPPRFSRELLAGRQSSAPALLPAPDGQPGSTRHPFPHVVIMVVVRERRPAAGSAPGPRRTARHAARLRGGLPVHVVHIRKDRDGPRETRNQWGRIP
jgi:hypothetical protein